MPRYRYELAHHTFREYCNRNPKEFFAKMTAKNSEAFLKGVLVSVGEIEDAEDLPVTAKEIKVFENKIDLAQVLFIKMPKPKAITDAYFIGIVLSNAKKDVENSCRYFTLEMTADREGSEKSVLCEWTKKGHRNYGLVPGKSLAAFLKAIIQEIKTDDWDGPEWDD